MIKDSIVILSFEILLTILNIHANLNSRINKSILEKYAFLVLYESKYV